MSRYIGAALISIGLFLIATRESNTIAASCGTGILCFGLCLYGGLIV